MKYTKERLDFYNKIDYINRYKTISKKYDCPLDSALNKTKKETVIMLFKKLGYDAKYINRESFYQIKEKQYDNIDFVFWVSLKYGVVEMGMSGKNYNLNIIATGLSFHRLNYTLGEELEIPKLPSFKSYEELEGILKAYLQLYKDFKKAFLNQYAK